MMSHRSFRENALLALFVTPFLAGSALSYGPVGARQAASTTAAPVVTAVSECHLHESTQFCMVGAEEYRILSPVTATEGLASSYTDCHQHGRETFCVDPRGEDVQITGANAAAAAPTPTGPVTAVTGCHTHETQVFCLADDIEYIVSTQVTATTDLPPAYTDCHSHGADMFCVAPNGEDVEITLASEAGAAEDNAPGEANCHFHAGVEHCVGGGESESGAAVMCDKVDRDYNIGLRVGLLFVIMATSSIGVFGPIVLQAFFPRRLSLVIVILRQFGTGVIISTAFVHLYTHASLMFGNACLGELGYEGTTSAIVMAGLFLSFLVEYCGQRLASWQANKKAIAAGGSDSPQPPSPMVNIAVLEAGIIFHSLLIGLTLVVAGDSFFLTLFAVIVFHQAFEGIALGTRLAALGTTAAGGVHLGHGHGHGHGHDLAKPDSAAAAAASQEDLQVTPVAMWKKLLLAAAFALVTPIGMAIGIGVLKKFNGNDPSTIIAIGTLDAFSAGILVWVGVVEMWAADWMMGGEMTSSGIVTTVLGLISLVAGMILMSFLGKWA